MPSNLADRITSVRRAIADATERAGWNPDGVTLVAVAKTVPRAVVNEAYALGIRHFGENRVQEAIAKYSAPLPPDARLHLVGQLQSNKARPAVDVFDLLESVDRPSLLRALDTAGAKAGRAAQVLLQVNVAGEPQKAGCAPEDLRSLLAEARACDHVDVRGLMTIAPLVGDPEDARPVFRALRRLRDEMVQAEDGAELPILSMGMSNDYVVAIEEGATHVRVGRALFGDETDPG